MCGTPLLAKWVLVQHLTQSAVVQSQCCCCWAALLKFRMPARAACKVPWQIGDWKLKTLREIFRRNALDTLAGSAFDTAAKVSEGLAVLMKSNIASVAISPHKHDNRDSFPGSLQFSREMLSCNFISPSLCFLFSWPHSGKSSAGLYIVPVYALAVGAA